MSAEEIKTQKALYRALDAREETLKRDLAHVRELKADIAAKMLLADYHDQNPQPETEAA